MSALNRVKFYPTATGIGPFVVSAHCSGFLTPAESGMANGQPLSYVAESPDKLQWEYGQSTYTAAGTLVARNPIRSSAGLATLCNFTVLPTVSTCFLAEDVPTGAGPASAGVPTFGSRVDALPAVIDRSTQTIQLLGYSVPGDGGGGAYEQIGSPISDYVGNGVPSVTPPNFASGGYPINVFSTTVYEINEGSGLQPSVRPILAGCLTIAILWDTQLGAPNPPAPPYTPIPSFKDSAGNTYLLVDNGVTKAFASSPSTGTTGAYPYFRPVGIYYCANPVFAPAGTSFVDITSHPNNAATQIDVFCFPGFTGATVDAVATAANDTSTSSVSLASGALTAAQELVIGVAHLNQSPVFTPGLPTYTLPSGWSDISPPKGGRNVIACAVSSSAAGLTFNPTFTSGNYSTTTIVATFKTYPLASIAPVFWKLRPSQPVHTAQYGIDPNSRDNSLSFRAFTRWMASVSPPSDTTNGRGLVDLGSVVIVLGPPTVIYVSKPYGFQFNLRNGQQVSFSTTGALPHGGASDIVAGKLYYVQYGTVAGPLPFSIVSIVGTTMTTSGNPPLVPGVMISAAEITNNTFIVSGSGNTWTISNSFNLGARAATMGSGSFQISEATIFAATGSTFQGDAQVPTAKGTALSAAGGGASQSGTHTLISYGDGWTDFVLDPGIYTADRGIAPGLGSGLKKVRLWGKGAKFATDQNFASVPWLDINAPINAIIASNVIFQTQFQTTVGGSGPGGTQANSIILLRPAEASNYYVNSWVLLMCNEVMGGNVAANWNCYIFEYQKIKSINATTGKLTFWDTLKFNYPSTLPHFVPPGGPLYAGQFDGPATIAQLNDCFDQELEIHNQTIYGSQGGQCSYLGVLSVKLIDCEIYSQGFKAGPFCSTMRNFTLERCICHFYQPEFDKMTDTIKIIDCELIESSYLFFQSASINKTIIERTRLEGGIDGTPKDMTIRDSVVGGRFRINTVYGPTERITLINTTIGEVVNQYQQGAPVAVARAGLTFANGTFKADTSGNMSWKGSTVVGGCPFPWGVQGAKILFSTNVHVGGNPAGIGIGVSVQDTMAMLSPFTVLNVYVDGSDNYCLDTDLPFLPTTTINLTGSISAGTNQLVVASIDSPTDACLLSGMTIVQNTGGSLPANTTIAADIGVPNVTGGLGTYTLSANGTAGPGSTFTASINDMFFLPHPCPRFTVINCTGGDFIADLSGMPLEVPMYSYFKRAFTGFGFQQSGQPANYVKLAGNLKTWTIDVQKPYTGAATTYPLVLYIFGYKTVGSNTYPTFAVETIDLKTAGVRTITSTGVYSQVGNNPYTAGGLGADALVAIPFFISGGHPVIAGQPRPMRSVVGNGTTVTCKTPFPHGLTGTINLVIANTSLVNGTFLCTVTAPDTFTFANAAVGTSTTIGSYSSSIGSEKIDKMPRFVMTAQTDHGVDWGSMSVNTASTGVDLIADTMTGAGQTSH